MTTLRILLLSGILGATALLTGCADTSTTNSQDQPQVSSIPWNHPESTEDSTALGGFSGTH